LALTVRTTDGDEGHGSPLAIGYCQEESQDDINLRPSPLLEHYLRVHTSSAANEAAKSLRARAFTHQQHIWLGANQSPDNIELMRQEARDVVEEGAALSTHSAASATTSAAGSFGAGGGGPVPAVQGDFVDDALSIGSNIVSTGASAVASGARAVGG